MESCNREESLALNAFRESVSRETLDRLKLYHDLLLRWQKVKNLVSKNTLEQIWSRHFLDSAQIVELAPDGAAWLDLGSGAGFPGMVVAILQVGAQRACEMHLVEADNRKCAFLRDVSRETGVPVVVHCARIEDIIETMPQIDVVTARALAPLSKLIEYSLPLIQAGAKGIFLKGQDVGSELTNIAKYSMLNIVLRNSKTDSNGRLVMVRKKDA